MGAQGGGVRLEVQQSASELGHRQRFRSKSHQEGLAETDFTVFEVG